MFCKAEAAGYKQMADGIEMKVMVYGANMLMSEFKLKGGSVLPEHQHPHEQTGYVISGKIKMLVKGEQPFEAGPGEAWSIPGGVPHSAETMEDSVVIEVFNPIRQDFLDK